MDSFDPKRFGVTAEAPLPRKVKPLPRHRQGEKFLRGPIPWIWLSKAAQQPGHALHVAIALWFIGWMEKSAVVTLSPKLMRGMGVHRLAMRRGLTALVVAGLVRIEDNRRGRKTVIEILEVAGERGE